MSLVKDLADTLRAVVAARATGMPIDPILPEVKAVLERAEAASVVLGGMRSEQRADFESLVEFAPKDNATFSMLFALVRELDSAASLNCMLLNAATDSFHDERHRADRAEQQLATVTAERDELKRGLRHAIDLKDVLQEQKAAAEREVERLSAQPLPDCCCDDGAHTRWAQRTGIAEAIAETSKALVMKAEAERDALRDRNRVLETYVQQVADEPIGYGIITWVVDEARELARLKGEKGGG